MGLLLIRHGRSAHVQAGAFVSHDGIHRWRDAYDEAGIASDDDPPAALIAEVGDARRVVASDLPRAIASAERLAPGRPLTVTPLFREVPLTIPPVPVIRAPLMVWATMIHVAWMFESLRGRGVPAEATARAGAAARWCAEACEGPPEGDVAIITHGVFRRLLAQRLRAEGWRQRPGWSSYAHWSAWRLDRPDARHG